MTVLTSDRGTFYQSFGTLVSQATYASNNEGHFCEYLDIKEEIIKVKVYSDTNDCEGFIMYGHLGSVYTMRANGATSWPEQTMLGRIIGFGMYMGTGGTANQPLQIKEIYNACNCPASYFLGTIQPADMRTKAITGPADVKTLVYQKNYMEDIYG